MTTRGHIQGANRDEAIQCPPRLEEYIADDNPVRLLDAFVDARDRAVLGLRHVTVTRSYDTGEQRLVQGPCVELDCALEHGMSGGPIFMVDNLGAVIACAMVTSGTSYVPEGIGSLLYPGL